VLRERTRALARFGVRSLVGGVGSGFGRCCGFLSTGGFVLLGRGVCEGVIVVEQWYTGSTFCWWCGVTPWNLCGPGEIIEKRAALKFVLSRDSIHGTLVYSQ